MKDNTRYKNELKQKRKELKEQEKINERIANIYDTDNEKAAKRRFKTIYHQLDQFDDNTQKFLKNLNKKFDKTIEYHKNPQIPRTNNKIEGYFKITLPSHIKRIYRTREGLIRWIRLQKIRWMERNVLFNEQNKLQQYISTIYRNRKGKVIMIGNTISRICPYYREWNLKVARQKLGTIDNYTFHNDNGDDTIMSVYLTDSLNYNSGMFFGNSAKNITKGAYEVDDQPHLPKSIHKYEILYTVVVEYNDFKFLCKLLRDKENTSEVFWYVEPKTTEIQKGSRVISNQFSADRYYTRSFRDSISENERRAFDMFLRGKVCYSDNLTGTEFNTIMSYIK